MFEFIYDENERQYGFWWSGFEHMLGTLQEIEQETWICCPQHQAHFQLGLQYQVIHAETKEDAAAIWTAAFTENKEEF
jgi:hypothetical protein